MTNRMLYYLFKKNIARTIWDAGAIATAFYIGKALWADTLAYFMAFYVIFGVVINYKLLGDKPFFCKIMAKHKSCRTEANKYTFGLSVLADIALTASFANQGWVWWTGFAATHLFLQFSMRRVHAEYIEEYLDMPEEFIARYGEEKPESEQGIHFKNGVWNIK